MILIETRMTTFIKAKLNKLDEQKNIDIEYRVALNMIEYQIQSKLIFLRIIIPKFMMTMHLNVSCKI